MTGQLSEDAFFRALRGALRQLYHPAALSRNPLNDLLGTQGRPVELQEILLDAVRMLRPIRGVSAQSDARRTYQILSHRYVEQFSQNEVATSFGLSVRQLRRYERQAIRSLGEYLRTHYRLEISAGAPDAEEEDDGYSNATNERYQEDLEWLEQTAPQEFLDMGDLIASALQTTEPLFQELNLSVQTRLPSHGPRVAANAIALRQALVITLTAVARLAANGQLQIGTTEAEGKVQVEIRPAGQAPVLPPGEGENLAMAQRLVALSGGSLSVQGHGERDGPPVILTLPTAQPATVLIIDDNQDALQLCQRYMTGTCFHPAVTSNPIEGLALAQQIEPQAILLDVMLPGMDGWELLARLRRHPATQHIPVIICTILPEEQLARSLGAAGFLRKPLTREDLLAALQTVCPPTPHTF